MRGQFGEIYKVAPAPVAGSHITVLRYDRSVYERNWLLKYRGTYMYVCACVRQGVRTVTNCCERCSRGCSPPRLFGTEYRFGSYPELSVVIVYLFRWQCLAAAATYSIGYDPRMKPQRNAAPGENNGRGLTRET